MTAITEENGAATADSEAETAIVMMEVNMDDAQTYVLKMVKEFGGSKVRLAGEMVLSGAAMIKAATDAKRTARTLRELADAIERGSVHSQRPGAI